MLVLQQFHDMDQKLLASLGPVLDVAARYSEAEMAPAVNKLVARIKELEEEVARLKGGAS